LLLRTGEQEQVLVLTMHHIISDGWSVNVLMGELRELYESYSRGEESRLEELPIQYADYAVWQREWLQGEVLEEQLSYWRKQLEGMGEAVELPLRSRGKAEEERRGEGKSWRFELEPAVVQRLREVSRESGVTLYMSLLAGFKVLLARYSGQEDIVVGTATAGRTRGELEGLIGFFVNTLVLRTEVGGGVSFRELLGRVRETVLGAQANQDLPFEKLVEELQPERELERTPLFQIMFSWHSEKEGEWSLPGLRMEQQEVELGEAKFDFTMWLGEKGGRLRGIIEYKAGLYEEEMIAKVASHYQVLLEELLEDIEQDIRRVSMLTRMERRQLLEEWNRTETEYGNEKSVDQQFEEQVERTPEAIAVVQENRQLSYGELNRRANQLARFLRMLGAGPDVRVGIFLEASPEKVVALLAVLKAGAAYVPLDPAYPEERLKYIAMDAQIAVLLTEQKLQVERLRLKADVVYLDQESHWIGKQSCENLEQFAVPDNLAYVIYTSGSTGQPKGVMVRRQGVMNHLQWTLKDFPLTVLDRMLQRSTFAFDSSVWEFFAPLVAGSRLVLLSQSNLDLESTLKDLSLQQITHVQFTPSALQSLLAQNVSPFFKSVQCVFCGGERVSAELWEQFRKLIPAILSNLYGPTETTILSTSFLIPAGTSYSSPIPIGTAISNTQLYVLDRNLQLVPVGAPGELYIGGDGVSRGYIGKPGLTAERFVPDLYGKRKGERLYRTGDIVRYLHDGNLEFIGRADHQVKVRGYRIELAEIETALATHESIQQCVVVAREVEPGDTRLIAYVVLKSGKQAGTRRLYEHLKLRLPDYMVPSAFIEMQELPLTSNQKIDLKKLPVPNESYEPWDVYVEPRNGVEELLAEAWSDVLRTPQVGVHDNFFRLGGHSLLATQLILRIRETLKMDLPLRALFQQPTIAELAEMIRGQEQNADRVRRIEETFNRIQSMTADDVQRALAKGE